MKKRFLAMLLALVMVLSCAVSGVLAAEYVENPLNESHKNVYAGTNFDRLDKSTVYNPLNLNIHKEDPLADFSYWHFVDTSDHSHYAVIVFQDTDGELVTWRVEINDAGKHYDVVTPSGWKLVDGVSYADSTGNFNLSRSGRHEAELSKVIAHGSVTAWHNQVTPIENYERNVDEFYERTQDDYYTRSVDEFYERTVDTYFERTVDEYYQRTVDKYYERPVTDYYERDVDEFYERDVDEYYERAVDEFYQRTVDEYYERDVAELYTRTVDEYFERTVDKYYERDVWDIYQRYAQRYLVPVFERTMAASYDGTLVTRLAYDGDTAKAKPINGGAFKNGHTYVAVDVEAASQEGGLWYTIADSSKNNGKKTPAEYNRPIDYQYNVQIHDGKLTITCPYDLAYAGVGCYVYAQPPKDAHNAPKHYEGTVTVDLPEGYGDTVYLYTHFERLGWYETDDQGAFVYHFVEWRNDPARTEYDTGYSYIRTEYGDYELVNTVFGKYNLVDTVYGKYELADTTYGEYELADTSYGDYVLVDTQYGEYGPADTSYSEYELVDTQYGAYEKVDTVRGDYQLVDTVYGDYALVDTQYGDYALVDTVYGEYELARTAYGEYEFDHSEFGDWNLVDTAYGNYELVSTNARTVRVEDAYTGTLTLTVNGEGKPLDTEFELAPGVYEFVLSGEGFEPVSKTVTIVAGENAEVTFDTIEVQNPDETMDTEVNEADRAATRYETTLAATRHEADRAATRHEADLSATEHFADKEAEKHYTDKAATEHHKDVQQDDVQNDREATRHDSDREAEKHYANKEATRHEADKAAEKHYADREATKTYEDLEAVKHYTDLEAVGHWHDRPNVSYCILDYIFREDIQLGDEIDAFSEYAIRLN